MAQYGMSFMNSAIDNATDYDCREMVNILSLLAQTFHVRAKMDANAEGR